MIRMSVSSLSVFQRCERRFYYGTVLQMPREWSWPLEFGTAAHAVLQAYDEAYGEGLDAQIKAGTDKALEYLAEWPEWRWTDVYNPWQLARIPVWYGEHFGTHSGVSPAGPSEIEFSLDIDGVEFRGRFDGIVNVFGEQYILERKTTSKSIGEAFYLHYLPDLQFSAYLWIARQLWPERKIKGILLEGIQLATGWVDFARYPILRSEDELVEIRESLSYYLGRRKSLEGAQMRNWIKNEANCFGCPFRFFCAQSDALRAMWQSLPNDKALL